MQFGTQFVALDTGEMQGACVGRQVEGVHHGWENKWEWHDTLFEISCQQDQMNTNVVVKTMLRPKCWLGWQTVPLCDDAKCLFVGCV